FGGLALDRELEQRGAEAHCGLLVIDLRSGDAVHWLRLAGMVRELYDVAVLPQASRPMALGFKTDEIQWVIALGEGGLLECQVASTLEGRPRGRRPPRVVARRRRSVASARVSRNRGRRMAANQISPFSETPLRSKWPCPSPRRA